VHLGNGARCGGRLTTACTTDTPIPIKIHTLLITKISFGAIPFGS